MYLAIEFCHKKSHTILGQLHIPKIKTALRAAEHSSTLTKSVNKPFRVPRYSQSNLVNQAPYKEALLRKSFLKRIIPCNHSPSET